MSNPFAALFEDVEPTTDPILAEVDLEGGAFAPLAPPLPSPAPAPTPTPSSHSVAPSASAPTPRHAASASPMQSAVHEMLSPPPGLGSQIVGRRKSIQQALVITWEAGREPDLLELNDLLASGWRVATTAGFPSADSGRGSLLVVVEQEVPR